MMTTPITPEEMQRRLDASPMCCFLGMKVSTVDAAASMVAITIAMRPEIERGVRPGQFHGGAIATLIDVAGDCALLLVVGDFVPTINLRVDYLRPAMGSGLTATARVRRAGRRIGVVDIDVTDAEGRLVAVGRSCYATEPG